MKTIRFNFTRFWRGFDESEFLRRHSFLIDEYEFVRSDDPQIVFESVFAGRHGRELWPKALQVFYTGERTTSVPLDHFDYCITFHRDIESPRHLRMPNFIQRLYGEGDSLRSLIKHANSHPEKRDKFCVFLNRNGNCHVRNQFVQKLSQVGKVDCPGQCLNNMKPIPSGTDAKLKLFRQYRFAVCFENASSEGSEGYVTEKLPDGMRAGCIPLYWGDRRVAEDFNIKSFVDFSHDSKIDAMVDKVAELERDRSDWSHITSESWFPGNSIPDHLSIKRAIEFFRKILQPF